MDQFEIFVNECHRRHDSIDGKLDRIATKLDDLKTPLVTRMDEVERKVWFQRIILGLCVVLVSVHPVGVFIVGVLKKVYP